jgi:hypothetical protein
LTTNDFLKNELNFEPAARWSAWLTVTAPVGSAGVALLAALPAPDLPRLVEVFDRAFGRCDAPDRCVMLFANTASTEFFRESSSLSVPLQCPQWVESGH